MIDLLKEISENNYYGLLKLKTDSGRKLSSTVCKNIVHYLGS